MCIHIHMLLRGVARCRAQVCAVESCSKRVSLPQPTSSAVLLRGYATGSWHSHVHTGHVLTGRAAVDRESAWVQRSSGAQGVAVQREGHGSSGRASSVSTATHSHLPRHPLDTAAPAPAPAPAAAPALSVAATVQILKFWSQYGRLLPILKRYAADQILVAVKALFEEYMLYIIKRFAAVTADACVVGRKGIDSKFYAIVERLLAASHDPKNCRALEEAIDDAAKRASQHPGAQQAPATAKRAPPRRTTGSTSPGAPVTSANAAYATKMQEQRTGAGNLYGLFEGVIACDALATLAAELQAAKPQLKVRILPCNCSLLP